MVKPTANKRSCNSFRNRKMQISADTTKITNVIKTTTPQLKICCLKFQFLSKVNPKFRAEAVGVKFWSRIGVGKKTLDFVTLPLCTNNEQFCFIRI